MKISLLDKDREIAMRRRLDKRVKMYTGDDFNYAELIAGDAQGYSHALLGIFDAIAPAAAAALASLASRRSRAGSTTILAPTVPLSRHIFRAPTQFYKNRRRLHGLSQRPSGPFHHGRRPGKRALDPASRRAVPAGRQGGAVRATPSGRPHA